MTAIDAARATNQRLTRPPGDHVPPHRPRPPAGR
jgi:hypothetical protein